MRISTKGRYALRLMLDLASNGTGNPIRLRDVAERQQISEKYLEQIVSTLNKAGFVRSIRGPMGGYILSGMPSDYTVGRILRLTEGDLEPLECVGNKASCDREDGCITRLVWRRLADAINGVVDGITLEDLLDWEASAPGDGAVKGSQ